MTARRRSCKAGAFLALLTWRRQVRRISLICTCNSRLYFRSAVRRRLTDATRRYADTQDGKVPHLRWPNALRVFEFSISCSRVSWPGMQDGLQWKSKDLRSRGILKWHLIKRTHVSAEFANSLLIKELCYSLWVRSPHLVEAIFHLSPPHMWKGVACGWIRWWWWVPINSLVFASRRRMWEKFSSQVN